MKTDAIKTLHHAPTGASAAAVGSQKNACPWHAGLLEDALQQLDLSGRLAQFVHGLCHCVRTADRRRGEKKEGAEMTRA